MMKVSVTQLVRPEILGMNPYCVPHAADFIKLDAMENPYNLPHALRVELGELIANVDINRYPDASAQGVKAALKQAFAIPAEASVLLGNGSDEIIGLVTQALARPRAYVMALEPSFVMYRMNAIYSSMQYIGVSLKPDFSLDLPATLASVREYQPAVIFLSYPNNPTGPRFARQDMEAILDAATGLVVVDEAYRAFASDSFMSLAGKVPNLIVMGTLSKLGLAGIRLGYAAGGHDWVCELDKVRPPYNVNVLTQAVAEFALRHLHVFQEQAENLKQERARLMAALARFAGVEVFGSEANFVTIRVPDADGLFSYLKQQRILIKNLSGSHPLLENCLRITVGSHEENSMVLDALHGFWPESM